MVFGYQTICSASAETLVEVLRSLDGVPDEKICVRASYRLDRSRLEPVVNLRKTRAPKTEPTLPATRSTTSKAA